MPDTVLESEEFEDSEHAHEKLPLGRAGDGAAAMLPVLDRLAVELADLNRRVAVIEQAVDKLGGQSRDLVRRTATNQDRLNQLEALVQSLMPAPSHRRRAQRAGLGQ